MSRSDVLVDADWVEAHRERSRRGARRGGRGHQRLRHRATSAVPSRSTGRRTCRTRSAVTSSTRPVSRRCCPSAASPTTTPSSCTAATTTGSPPTRTGTSSCTGTRTSSCSTAAGRSGSWTPASWSPTCRSGPRPATRPASRTPSIRAFRDEVVAAIGKQNLVDVRSPDEFAGRLLAPAHLPQEQAQRGGHIPTAKNVPWSKAAEDDGTFKSDDALRALYGDGPGVDFGKRHHRLLPDRRAVRAHLVRAARTARPAEREELRRLVDRVRLAGRRSDRARGWPVTGDQAATAAAPPARRGRRVHRGRRQPGDRAGQGNPERRAGAGRVRPAAQLRR